MMYEAIKYCDIFGTKFSFYTDEKPRFYSFLGGVLSLLLIIVCIIVFIFYGLDDFKRNTPIVTSSFTPSEEYHKVKFGEEKIWIPWRVVDLSNKYINHKNIIYPNFTYYSLFRNNTNNAFNSKNKKLNYKLCNETSMINKPEIYKINIQLDKLYCIDMDDLEMGGSWISLFINYVKMDFYLCEDGIDYNETNSKCTTKKEIINRIGYNNSLYIEYYYPVIQFQPTNISYPIIVGYRPYYYYISKLTYKIDRLYLRKFLLKDDLGWVGKNKINLSYWGFSEINGDSYAISSKIDLINGGSTSRFYSLNIYLEPGIIYYERKYKKIIQIIIEGFPIIFIVLTIFKKIAKTFKFSEENKKLFELLFENINENINEKKYSSGQLKRNLMMMKKNKFERKKKKSDRVKLSLFSPIHNHNTVNSSLKDGSKLNFLSPNKDHYNFKSFHEHKTENPSKVNNKRKKLGENNQRLNLLKNSLIRKIENDSPSNKAELISNDNCKISKLFPYRYYYFSIFIKNFDVAKLMCCFSKKFAKVYTFLGRMFDISSYLIVLREFHILKNIILEVKDVYKIERPSKINIGEKKFIKNMNECLVNNNFSIFYQNASKKFK